MIEKEEIKQFLNQYVRIGVPHDMIPSKLFFYFGHVKDVNNTEVKIKTSNGFKIIPLENIMDIHLAGGRP